MKIERSPKYRNNFFQILDYIAQDKFSASENFKNELDNLIEDLPNFPYKYRKSIYFDDKDMRDLIFKGYVVPYKVDEANNQIIIIGVNKYKANLDNKVNKKLFKTKKIDFILEGGSVDSNGDGIILATLKSLVDKNRNNLSKKQMEKKLKQYLNIYKILWLKYGYLLGDDTDGHIDTLARFVSKDTVMYIKCDDKTYPYYDDFRLMEKQLHSFDEIKTLIALPWVSGISLKNSQPKCFLHGN